MAAQPAAQRSALTPSVGQARLPANAGLEMSEVQAAQQPDGEHSAAAAVLRGGGQRGWEEGASAPSSMQPAAAEPAPPPQAPLASWTTQWQSTPGCSQLLGRLARQPRTSDMYCGCRRRGQHAWSRARGQARQPAAPALAGERGWRRGKTQSGAPLTGGRLGYCIHPRSSQGLSISGRSASTMAATEQLQVLKACVLLRSSPACRAPTAAASAAVAAAAGLGSTRATQLLAVPAATQQAWQAAALAAGRRRAEKLVAGCQQRGRGGAHPCH